MPRATWIQQNFNAGEWSPTVYGRVGLDKYKNALATCLNYVPTVQGMLTRRPGTRYVANSKGNNAVRFQRFEFSTTQAYVLEFGNNYIRFYTNDGQLLSGGVPYEVATTYTTGELFELNFTQSADVLYITHPSHAPAKLQRLGATSWTLTSVSFVDGPYLNTNSTATTLTPSGTTGAVTVTASAVTGINNGSGFRASDVGRMLRIKCGGVWLWGTITAYTDTTHVTWTIADPTGTLVPRTATAHGNASGGSIFTASVDDGGSGYGNSPPSVTIGGAGSGAVAYATLYNGTVVSVTMSVTGTGYGTGSVAMTLSAPSAIVASSTTFWRLGVWNSTDGYPSVTTFYQDRLCFAGSTNYPQRVDCSATGDYENFAPSNVDGTVVDSNGLSFTLSAAEVNAVRWIISDEKGMLVGTTGGEWVVRPSSVNDALTPTNISAKQATQYGSANVQAFKIGKATLFISRDAKRMREMAYVFQTDGFQSPDISLVSNHLLLDGIKQIAVQKAPQQILWLVRNDGALLSCTYDREQDVVAWAEHTLGGTEVNVESVAIIPSSDGTRDEVWLVVKRTINGSAQRHVEYMTKFWETGDAIETAAYLDSSAQYSGSPATTVSGLTWLEGATVSVLADGAVHPDCTVASGAITLSWSASVVQVGLGYNSDGKTMRIEAGGAEGVAQGKFKRIHRVIFRFTESLGLQLYSDIDGTWQYVDQSFRTSADAMDEPVALFSGDKRWSWEGTWDTDGYIAWRQNQPLPSNILAVIAQMETQDGG